MKADCHIHMVLDAEDWKNAIARHEVRPDTPYIRNILSTYKDMGYTYLRDGGDNWGVSAMARDLAPEYGIVYTTPLSPISKLEHYGGFIGQQFSTLREYAQLVAEHRQQNADFIKIMISGLMDFHQFGRLSQEGLPAADIREMVHIAHEEGFAVMAHANGARVLEAAAIAGVDSVEHGAYADKDALHAMAESKVVWVPTVSTVGNLLNHDAPDRFDRAPVQKLLENFLENIAFFAHLGGTVAPGTDAGAWAVPHGCQTEENWLLQAGITDAQLQHGIEAIVKRFHK